MSAVRLGRESGCSPNLNKRSRWTQKFSVKMKKGRKGGRREKGRERQEAGDQKTIVMYDQWIILGIIVAT
jgi:hypothetical protein